MTDEVQTSAQADDEENLGGRPPFEPSTKQRRDVAIAAAGGMTQEAIASALGISPPTLRKHFAVELGAVASKRRLEVLTKMFRTAMKGNVSAQKAFLAAGDASNAAPPPAPAEKHEKPGKKETAQADAKTAADGTGWGSILTPGAPLQ